MARAQTTYMGVPMMQTYADLELWEMVLNAHPIASLVELGTAAGGMAMFLKAQAIARGFRFYTIDRKPSHTARLGGLLGLGESCLRFDLFGPGVGWMQRFLTQPDTRPCLVFCDDGDKPLEVKTFAPMLRVGDILAVHDWEFEIGPDDMNVVPGMKLTPVMERECRQRGSLTRWWMVRFAAGGAP